MDDYGSPFDEQSPSPTWGDEVPQRRSSWPTVFGVLGIIYAAFTLLGGCCSVGVPFLIPVYVDFMKQAKMPQDQIDAALAGIPPTGWAIASGIIGITLAVLLLVGAIRLLQRRRIGARLLLIWSIIQTIWSVIALAVGVVLQMGAISDPATMFGAVIGVCFGIIFNVALPVLTLIWLNRATIKAEVAQWP